MKVYLSGPITGLNMEQAKKNFEKAEVFAKEFLNAKEVVNPFKLPHNHDQSYVSYLLEDLQALSGCNAILMLPNWKKSKGARIEHNFAKEFEIKIYLHP